MIDVQHNDGVLSLVGEIGFDNAGAALEQGQQAIATSKELTIDLGGLTHSNSAGLAIMIEWLATARRHGHSISFKGIPDGLSQLAEVCQVREMLPER